MGILDVLVTLSQTPAERRDADRDADLRRALAAAAAANERQDRMEDLRAEATSAQLQAVIRRQNDQVTQLNAAIGVLIQMLADTGAIDADAFRWRVEAALVNAEPEKPAQAAAASEPMITCKNCQRSVPRKDSEITARGVMCERCALAASF